MGVNANKAAKDGAKSTPTGTSGGTGGGGGTTPTAPKATLTITLLSTGEPINIHFDALKTFTDSTKSNVESTQVFGRADPIKIFGSSSRSLTFTIMFPSSQKEDKEGTGVVAYLRFIHRLMYRGLDSQMVASEPPIISINFTGPGVPNSNVYVGYLNECTFGGEQGLITTNAGNVSEKDLLANNILLHKKSVMNFSMDVIHTSYPGTVNGKPPPFDFWGLAYPPVGPGGTDIAIVAPGTGGAPATTPPAATTGGR